MDRLGRDMQRLIYIDARPLSFWLNPDNCKYEYLVLSLIKMYYIKIILVAIPILEYTADSTIKDNKLLELIDTLEEIKNL
jgi:hypothetical protein